MAVDPKIIERITTQVNNIINEETPDYRNIDYYDWHTHTIDDIPQLLMLFNTGYFDSIYDKYYNNNTHSGYILYNNDLLINYGEFKYNNHLMQTEILLPLAYSAAHNNLLYMIHYTRSIEYGKEETVNEPIDITYDISIINKTNYSFTVKSPQLYIPEKLKYNYFTIGMIDK